jgi:hypothetical protein
MEVLSLDMQAILIIVPDFGPQILEDLTNGGHITASRNII